MHDQAVSSAVIYEVAPNADFPHDGDPVHLPFPGKIATLNPVGAFFVLRVAPWDTVASLEIGEVGEILLLSHCHPLPS
jgi:hypothetical protein